MIRSGLACPAGSARPTYTGCQHVRRKRPVGVPGPVCAKSRGCIREPRFLTGALLVAMLSLREFAEPVVARSIYSRAQSCPGAIGQAYVLTGTSRTPNREAR